MLTTQHCMQQDESFTSHQNSPRESDYREASPDIICTVKCSCKSTCQRKGCPCKAASKLCGELCKCGTKKKPCKNQVSQCIPAISSILHALSQPSLIEDDVHKPDSCSETGRKFREQAVQVKWLITTELF